MNTEQEKLKPCPFCGGQVELETVKSRAGTLYGVVCRNTGNRGCTCAMEQVPSRSAEAAIARWNMRKPEDELRAEIDALREDAERYRWLSQVSTMAEQLSPAIIDAAIALHRAMPRVEIPDFTPGNGNSARRRAETLGIDYDAAMAEQVKP